MAAHRCIIHEVHWARVSSCSGPAAAAAVAAVEFAWNMLEKPVKKMPYPWLASIHRTRQRSFTLVLSSPFLLSLPLLSSRYYRQVPYSRTFARIRSVFVVICTPHQCNALGAYTCITLDPAVNDFINDLADSVKDDPKTWARIAVVHERSIFRRTCSHTKGK